jgi:DNA-binding transcriptional MocR family regulator
MEMHMPDWRPSIPSGPAPLHERLAEAVAADITTGSLAPGTRLPTHRGLARALGIGLGSVTRAYALAMQRGLIEARVGRGSFVAHLSATRGGDDRGSGRIDMAHNIPPIAGAERRFAEALGRVRRRPDLLDHLNYPPPAGFETHRRAAAAWLRRTANFDTSEWTRLLVTGGAQEAMSVVLGTIARAGETVMVEAATFFGVRSLCDQTGLKLKAVAMDEQGIVPDSLEQASRTGCRVLYMMPTLQNPTGRTMGATRRAEIARVVRRRELWIVEDDIYSAFAGGRQPEPFAVLVPERTFYISGLSKALAPGLRVGFVCAPSDEYLNRLIATVRARSYAPATLGALVATDWIESGAADEIVRDVRAEVRARTALGKEIFATALDPSTSDECPHLWLPMQELQAERLANRAIRAGIDVTPPGAPVIDRSMIYGVRVCLGAIRDRAILSRTLGTIAGFLSEDDLGRDHGVV